jgi:hypothetical protein
MKMFQLIIGALLLMGMTVLAAVTNSTNRATGGHSTVLNVPSGVLNKPSGVISNMPSSVIQKPSGVIRNKPSGVVSNTPDSVITNPPDDTTGDATNLPPQSGQ